jgi:hypothetical protein
MKWQNVIRARQGHAPPDGDCRGNARLSAPRLIPSRAVPHVPALPPPPAHWHQRVADAVTNQSWDRSDSL